MAVIVLHEILRLEPAEWFTKRNARARIPSGTWRTACRCGHLTRPRKERNRAAVDGVRHAAAYDVEATG